MLGWGGPCVAAESGDLWSGALHTTHPVVSESTGSKECQMMVITVVRWRQVFIVNIWKWSAKWNVRYIIACPWKLSYTWLVICAFIWYMCPCIWSLNLYPKMSIDNNVLPHKSKWHKDQMLSTADWSDTKNVKCVYIISVVIAEIGEINTGIFRWVNAF